MVEHKEELCEACKKNPASILHTCPFSEEMGGHLDAEEDKCLCNCCSDCEGLCVDEI